MEHQAWVSRYRNELKGIAILWVVFFHSQITLDGSWDWIRQTGYGGVDIFFFLMGMGLYHSLKKSDSLRGYASRRLWRILPAYLPVVFIWMAVMYPSYHLSTTQAIRGVTGNLLMVGFWLQSPSIFNWFVNAQFLFILLAPLMYAYLAKSGRKGVALLSLLGICAGLGLANIACDQMIGISRLPIFLLGMAFYMDWPISQRKNTVRVAYIAAFALGVAVLLTGLARYKELLIDYGLYWYPFALIVPGLCVFLAWLLHKAERARKLFAPLRWFGESSFEIYLLNIWMVELLKRDGVTSAGLSAFFCAGNLLAGIGYHRLVLWGTKALQAAWGSARPKKAVQNENIAE
ncbi:MAG TPA: acyltransferase [Candidatus Limiplasma sp.]|nr:acyltransferase [Candidatus Limiplasma sp.]HPS81764.1 acyltransferase [Candidatus Limiplasma sp.]